MTIKRELLNKRPGISSIHSLLTMMCLYAVNASALTWDAGSHGSNTGPNVIPASGNWDTNSLNWNNGHADVVWPQINATTAGTNTAIFSGMDGSYLITNTTQIAVANITINNSGYTFSDAGIDLASGGLLSVAAGKTVTFNCDFVSGNNSEYYWAGGGATVNINGNFSGQQPHFAGPVTNCAFNLGGVNVPSVLWVNAPVFLTNGSFNTSASFFIGYPATVNGTNYTAGSLTISGGAAATQNGGTLVVGRGGGQGTLTLFNGIVNVGVSGITARSLSICNDANGDERGIVNVEGGILNVGSVGSSVLNGQILLSPGGSAADESSILNQTNGVINAWGGIEFGAASGTYSGGSALLINSGGSLYVGPGGIFQGAVYPPTCNLSFSGGIVGALGNWSSALPITLGTNNGNTIFQCSDASDDPYDITLTGVLSGSGGLVKMGSGVLTLDGANSYAGPTSIVQGTLALNTAAADGGDYSVATNAILNLQMSTGNSSLTMSSLTLSAGSVLALNAGSSGNPSAPFIKISGALTPSTPVTVNVSGSLTNGEFSLLQYGTLGGAGFNAFVLGSVSLPEGTSGTAVLVDNTNNNSIDLKVTTYASGRLAWAGTVNGNWDIGITPNWQTNAYYTQTVSGGPAVVFDDTADGPYTTIVLNTNVIPSGVTFSNSLLTYSLEGSGGIGGIGGLTKAGTGLLILGGANTYSGGTTVSGGTVALTATNNAPMAYTNTGGTLSVSAVSMYDSVAMTSLTFGSNSPQLAFSLANFYGLTVPLISDSGSLVMNGNVAINVTNPMPGTNVLLAYAGTRSGTGSFVGGMLPTGATITDNPVAKTVSLIYVPQPQLIVPALGSNELVVAVVTPQDFGAKGDGITDDSAAFQNAMNWVYYEGGGGGEIFVPAGDYAFYTNLTIPTGVTLHGDWTDWTTGTNGLVGTTFKVYFGEGQTNAPAFIYMNSSSALQGINFWYPNQNPTDITGYPFTIQISGSCVLKNVVLVNSYQGIEATAVNDAARHVMSTLIGTPLYLGISLDMLADVSQNEDIRFSPNVWAVSGLTNAPAAGGSYAAWMRANGTAMRLLRVDGELAMDTSINGYKVGIEANSSTNGSPGATFYEGSVTNCGVALLAQVMPGQSGLQLTDFTLDGDIGVDRTTNANDATVGFDHCQIIGRKGTAVYATGADWHNWMAFQNCTISNTMQLAGPGVFNVVDSSLSGPTNCVMSPSVTRVALTGCTFGSTSNIINSGNAGNLLVDARQSISNTLPIIHWTNALNRLVACQPAKTNLYVVTDYGATGNGSTDDTVAIQNALTAAGANGGGLVYLPPGLYHLTNTLAVPSGVELRGTAPLLRAGSLSVLEPYGGQGTTNGPVAVALAANSGLVGVTFNYVAQGANYYSYPPTIQGRGANVYAIAVGNASSIFYSYVDLDTYTCPNHFLYLVDGWPLSQGFHVGNGSSGYLVDCQGNGSAQGGQFDYAATNSQMFVLGNCSEVLLKDFNINENTLMHCLAEGGQGPNVTAMGTYCDGTIQAYVLDAAAPCLINVINTPMAVFSFIAPALSTATVGVISTTNFLGTARFFNSALFGGPEWDFVVEGGDVGFDLVHMLDHAFNGSSVSGGVLHLINNGAYITYNGTSDFPPYNVSFGANAGTAGKISEFIGGYAYNGCTYSNLNTNNPVNIWQDYALSSYTDLSLTNQYLETLPVFPELSPQYSLTAGNLTLKWPDNGETYFLFTTPNLTPPVTWTQVTNAPVNANGQWMVNVQLNAGGNGFYSLEQ